MANYIFGVVRNRNILSEKAILEAFPEAFFYSLGGGFFFRISAGGSNSAGFSKGVKIDKSSKKIIFCNGEPDAELHTFVDGSYIEQSIEDYNVKISSDKFGMFPLFYSEGNDIFIASDSIMLVSYFRKLSGMRNEIDKEEFTSRSWLNAITYSLVSSFTPIKGISYLLPGFSVIITYQNDKLLTKIEKERDLIPSLSESFSYDKLLEAEAQNFLGILDGLAGKVHLSLSVSGGLDSRALIGAAERINNDKDKKIAINCKNNETSDYCIVEAISSKYFIPLNEKKGDVGNFDQAPMKYRIGKVSQWGLSSLACYDPLYAPGVYYKYSNNISLGGHGAETFKGNYGWRPFELIGKGTIPDKTYYSFQNQVFKSFAPILSKEVKGFSSEVHYLYYRNPIHGSRFMSSSLVAFRPMLMQSLIKVAYSYFYENRKFDKYKISKDFLLKINTKVALEPYDKVDKKISTEYAKNAYDELGSDEYSYPVYDVVGRPKNIRSGPVCGALEVAKHYGFYGNDFNFIVTSNLDLLKNIAVNNDVVEIFDNLVCKSGDSSLKDYVRGAALGKILTLLLTE